MAIKIGDKSFNAKTVEISHGHLFIDGVDITDQLSDPKTLLIEIQGDIDTINVDKSRCIVVEGEVKHVQMMTGTIECLSLTDSITTVSGDVCCGKTKYIQTIYGNTYKKKW